MPSNGNQQIKPARIVIHTEDQKEYQIDFSGTGKELLNLTYKKVTVQGKLREQMNGRAILYVRQYQVVKDAPENSVPNSQEV